jgi:hypothetical protein
MLELAVAFGHRQQHEAGQPSIAVAALPFISHMGPPRLVSTHHES